jgi:hypothetical protein
VPHVVLLPDSPEVGTAFVLPDVSWLVIAERLLMRFFKLKDLELKTPSGLPGIRAYDKMFIIIYLHQLFGVDFW